MPHPLMLIPEIGKGESLKLYQVSLACHQIAQELKDLSVKTIIILVAAPKDKPYFGLYGGDRFNGNFNDFASESMEIHGKLNEDFIQKLQELAMRDGLPVLIKATEECQLDEKVLIPLSFIQKYVEDYQLVPMTCPVFDDRTLYLFGMHLQEVAHLSQEPVAVLISSNLSQGPSATHAVSFDQTFLNLMTSKQPLSLFDLSEEIEFQQNEDVVSLMKILLGTLDGKRIGGELYAYQNPFGVGYGVLSLTALGPGTKAYKYIGRSGEVKGGELLRGNNPYVSLARKCMEDYMSGMKTLLSKAAIPEMMIIHRHGVFVSFYKEGTLLGRFGDVQPCTDCVATEIMHHTLSFIRTLETSMTEGELSQLKVTIDLALNPQVVTAEDLNPTFYGIKVSKGDHQGVILPKDGAYQSSRDQLLLACGQAGIPFSEQMTIERFEVIHYEE